MGIWLFAEFTKNFQKTFRKKMRISVEWIGTIPTEYQSHGEDFDGEFPPSFSPTWTLGMQDGAYH